MVLLELYSCCFRLAQTDSLNAWCKYVATTYSIYSWNFQTSAPNGYLTCIVPRQNMFKVWWKKGLIPVTTLTRGKGKVETKNNRSCILKAKIHSLVLIYNTFHQPSITTGSTLYCHLGWQLIDTQSTQVLDDTWLTLHRNLGWQSVWSWLILINLPLHFGLHLKELSCSILWCA